MLRSNRSLYLRLGATLLAAVLVAVIALVVINSGQREPEPTAAEAGAILKTHILKLFDELHARDIQVTDPGGKDVPCGDDGAKRTFAASGLDSAPERKPDILNSIMIGAMNGVADYNITDSSGATIRMENEPTKTVILLESTANGKYSVRGETQCLSRS
ncbi:hypothetical protein GCM10009555_082390 [Acrocarpospora macrocephala]|uniref:Uncharacterized protein n=1 Tax=Acrocarpospora macrocephala TaxID=150177 RepID=A0A5M3WRU9_9ACTN|nr:hypothetical protein [Acrocarpospora macrocephala]GES10872.1 hypothetical protein Amac_044690 [Acrocarpospora macrocephala]